MKKVLFEKKFIHILWIFSCNKCILVRLLVKVFVSIDTKQKIYRKTAIL